MVPEMALAKPPALSGARDLALEVSGLEVVYNHVILALRGVSLAVPDRGIVALLGANGAGKSTTLKAISGLLRAERGAVTGGFVAYSGERVHAKPAHELVRAGLIQVLEGRRCFPHLTVQENLLTGAFVQGRNTRRIAQDLDKVYRYFPRLRERRTSLAGYVSGGEQQMLAIGRALMSRPKMVLLDEPSMGLAPRLVEEIFEIMKALNTAEHVSILLAEQNASLALRYADYGYILETGRVALEGNSASLRENQDVQEFYLGLSSEGHRSFRDAGPTARRKRWLA